MLTDEFRAQIQNIVAGTLSEGAKDSCSTVWRHLRGRFGAGPTIKSEFESRAIIKKRESEFLVSWANSSGLWLPELPLDIKYLTRGGEASIYLSNDGLYVFKLNNAIYYATWTELFTSLLLHNILFSATAYMLIGFTKKDGDLFVVLKQAFIEGGQAELEGIKAVLNYNGFINTKRQDYYNKEFRIVLEDMHDENVIARKDVLFFIDTVFYLV